MKKSSIGVIFITHRAKHHLQYCLPPVINSPLKPRVLVVNSSSDDGTIEESLKLGAEILAIPRIEFNHGSTREKARHYLSTDIVVMMTPDAYAIDNSLLGHLVDPLIKNLAAVSYAKQIPHDGADLFESFPRQFNYPEKSHLRDIKDITLYGAYTFFCSNSCAAYVNKALDEVGGFPSVLLGEDTCAVAKLLKQGHKIAYIAEAVVKHSHRYSLKQEFARNFDIGLARKQFSELIKEAGRDEKRGTTYVLELTKKVLKEKPYLLPYCYLQVLAKLVAYKLGRASVKAPTSFKKFLSSQDFYWDSLDFLEGKSISS